MTMNEIQEKDNYITFTDFSHLIAVPKVITVKEVVATYIGQIAYMKSEKLQ